MPRRGPPPAAGTSTSSAWFWTAASRGPTRCRIPTATPIRARSARNATRTPPTTTTSRKGDGRIRLDGDGRRARRRVEPQPVLAVHGGGEEVGHQAAQELPELEREVVRVVGGADGPQ